MPCFALALLRLQGVSVCAVHGFDVQLIGIRILYSATVKGGRRCAPCKGHKNAEDKDNAEKFLFLPYSVTAIPSVPAFKRDFHG